MITNKFHIILIGISFSLFFTSCKQNTAKTIQPVKDYALIQREISSIIPLIIFETQSTPQLKKVLTDSIDSTNTCAEFIYISGDTSTNSFQDINFKIDFKAGCITEDNSIKEGEVNCFLINDYLQSGQTMLTFNNFKIDGNLFQGSLYIDYHQDGFNVHSDNLSIQVGKKQIQYSGMSVWTPINSLTNDTILLDNTFFISDSATLYSRYEDVYTVVSTSLLKKADCRWFTKGLSELVDIDNETQVIDYGTGTCDNKANVTSNGFNYLIDLQ